MQVTDEVVRSENRVQAKRSKVVKGRTYIYASGDVVAFRANWLI